MLVFQSSRWQAWKEAIEHWRGVFILAPTMAGLVIALRLTGGLQILEWTALDQFFRLRPPEPPDPRIVIVGIDESDVQRLGRWPIADTELAELLQKIKRQQPAAIGLDIVRDLSGDPGHAQLVKVFETTPNLIGIEFLANSNRAAIAPPPVLKQKGQVGFSNSLLDADGRLRRGLLYLPELEDQPMSLGMRLALIYLKPRQVLPQAAATNPENMQLGRMVFPRFAQNDGGYVRADDAGYQILLNFRGGAGSFPTVSLTDVMENRIAPDLMRDRIVLVGVTAISVRDYFLTPYSGEPLNFTTFNATPPQTSGVEIQATIASQLVSSALDGRGVIQNWTEPQEWLWILVWSVVGAALSWRLRSRRWTPVVILLIGSGLVVVCYLAFLNGWWLPLIPPLLAMGSAAAVLTAYIARLEQADRRIVMNLFERHVTHEIAEEIWRDRKQFLEKGRLPGRRMVATVLFADLKNFTLIAEHHDPEVLLSWLNEYLDAMAQIIVIHGGVVDKFIGDSVMAVFGVPIPHTRPEEIARDAQQAVKAAVKMALRLEQLNQKWQNEGLPTVTMRIGIATGLVVTGSLGGLQKLDYTTIGDTVNIAARLESYDKTFQKTLRTGVCRILINEETYLNVQEIMLTRFIDRAKLRGRNQATGIYQVLTK